ncbi:GNAT family N-acetyltransferase [Flavivirga algicola]|uniref:GNAT family N-acetyltransferase n=1 Tax=Flavivirga algicola TaxID=2729136 RepID=A0ABX1S356_9FLAO|nr:GNAT family N-acetyltransferase [Flavivirga algicola]NMH89648.1 GNAT family N-acetyltransferase [Flavivirga algicola]
MLKTQVKTFEALTKRELYDLLQLRSDIFVIEQDCLYRDIDGKDFKALHILGYIDKKIVAYARIFKPGDYYAESSMGRVIVAKEKRDFKYGHIIMKKSIEAIKDHYNTTSVRIMAQSYLKKFYSNFGFIQVGEEFLDDGIPHIIMIKE